MQVLKNLFLYARVRDTSVKRTHDATPSHDLCCENFRKDPIGFRSVGTAETREYLTRISRRTP
eukprot:5090903-Amphidinium_carterae.1